jgi:hypothetical protein
MKVTEWGVNCESPSRFTGGVVVTRKMLSALRVTYGKMHGLPAQARSKRSQADIEVSLKAFC